MPERDLDVVVLGATGVTGRRVAAYLDRRAPETGARWAAAARSTEKLRDVLAAEGVTGAELIAADTSDPASLAALAARTKVVLNLVGPYTIHGRPVIEACIEAGTHYADLTGEIPFVREIQDALHDRARDAGSKVVQVCGFEALPPDLAVLLAAETAQDHFSEPLAEADLRVVITRMPKPPRPSDALSGGTLQSMAEVAAHAGAASITDPAALVDDPVRAAAVRARSPIRIAPRRLPDGTVVGPMSPAAYINPAIIQRTFAVAAPDVAPPVFREGFGFPGRPATLPLRLAVAGVLSATQAGLGAVITARPAVRLKAAALMRRSLPGSGFGPAGDRLDMWAWEAHVDGRTARGRRVWARIEAEGHPGYQTTARMLGEAGLLLASPDATPDRAGCLTPALALGTAGLSRFDAAGMRFSAGSD